MEKRQRWSYKLIVWIIVSLRISTQICSAQQAEGKSLPSSCPALTRPHLTQCNKYYRCLMLPSNQHIWVVTNCEEGLIFDNELGVCVLSNSDWECNLSPDSNKTKPNDDSNVYGVNNLSLDLTPTSTASTTVLDAAIASYLDSDNSDTYPVYEQNDMSDYEEPEVDASMELHGETASHDDEEYQNPDDPLPTFVVNSETPNRNEGSSRYEILLSSGTNRLNINPSSNIFSDDIESNESSGDGYENNEIQRKDNSAKLPKDDSLIEKLQRLAQLVREIERINERTSSEENLTRVDQDFLAKHMIRIKQANKNTLNIVKLPVEKDENISLEDISNILKYQKIDKDGTVNSTVIQNTRIKPSVRPNFSPRPHLSRDPFTKIQLIASPADLKANADKISSYSNSQVVVNRPEGSVVFNVPASRPAPPPPPKVKSPQLSEDMLKTILELSQQLVHTSKENAARNPAPEMEKVNSHTHTVFKPIYITVPVPIAPLPPTPQITITNNANKYQGSFEKNGEDKAQASVEKSGEDKYPSLLTKADFERLNQSAEKLPQQVYYDSYGEKHIVYGPNKGESLESISFGPIPPQEPNFVLFSTSYPRISTTPAPNQQQPSRESFESIERFSAEKGTASMEKNHSTKQNQQPSRETIEQYSGEKISTSVEKNLSTQEVPFPFVKPNGFDKQPEQDQAPSHHQPSRENIGHHSAEKGSTSGEKNHSIKQQHQQPPRESIEHHSAEKGPANKDQILSTQEVPFPFVKPNFLHKRPEQASGHHQPPRESVEHHSAEKGPTSVEKILSTQDVSIFKPNSNEQAILDSFINSHQLNSLKKRPQQGQAPGHQQPPLESFEKYSAEKYSPSAEKPHAAQKVPFANVQSNGHDQHTSTSFVYSSQLNGLNQRLEQEQTQSNEKFNNPEHKRPSGQMTRPRPTSQEIPFHYVSPISEEYPEKPTYQETVAPQQNYGERIPDPVRISFAQHEEFDNINQPSGYSQMTRPAPPNKYQFQSPPNHGHHPYPLNAVNSQVYQPDNQKDNYYVVDQQSGEDSQNYKLVIPKAPEQYTPDVYKYQHASIEQAFAPIKKKYGGMEYGSSPYYQGYYVPPAPLASEELDSSHAAYSDDDPSENVAEENLDDESDDGVATDGSDDLKLVSLAGAYINYSAYKKVMGNNQHIPVSVLQCATGVRQMNTTDCTKYYICNPSNKQVVGFDCPHYTAFNADTKMCDAPTYARCRPAVITEVTIEDNKNNEMLLSNEQSLQQESELTSAVTTRKPSNKLRNRLKTKNPLRLKRPVATTTTERPSTTRSVRRKVKKPLRNKPGSIGAVPTATRTVTRPSCRRPGKLADPMDETKYILCFKNEQGVMKRHTLACAGNLVFCKRYSLCTKKARCVDS